MEGFVGADGWDQPGRLFALVSTAELVESQPQLAAELDPESHSDPSALTPVEQEIDVAVQPLERLLGQIGWPSAVAGALAVVERVVLPPRVEAEVPEDPVEADRFAAEHPDRSEVRIAAGVLRTGEAHCMIRLRSHEGDDHVLHGADLVPNLIAALRETLEVDEGLAQGEKGNLDE